MNAFSSQNNYSLMDYLVQKLDSRIKNIQSCRITISNIYELQDLIEKKKEILKHFYDIEDDIKQGTNAIRALVAQSKDCADQIIIFQRKNNNLYAKSVTDEIFFNELNEKNYDLLSQIDNYKKFVADLKSSNDYLGDRNYYLENEIKLKEKEIEDFVVFNNQNIERIEKLTEENSLIKMQLERVNNNLDEINMRSKYESSDLNDSTIFKKLNNKSEEFENLKVILNEKENNKKLINEKIKNHFNSDKDKLNNDENIKNILSNRIQNEEEISKRNFSQRSNNSLKSEKSEFLKEEKKKSNLKINKTDLLSRLVLKSVQSSESLNLLNQKFGSNFMQKMLSDDVEEEYLKQIDEFLSSSRNEKISNLDNPNIITNSKTNYNNQTNSKASLYKFEEEFSPAQTEESKRDRIIQEENEEYEHTGESSRPIIKNITKYNHSIQTLGSNISSRKQLNKFIGLSRSFSSSLTQVNPITEEYGSNFENSLRHYRPNSPAYKKNFVNFTNPYGRYFDKDLQTGGKTKDILIKGRKV